MYKIIIVFLFINVFMSCENQTEKKSSYKTSAFIQQATTSASTSEFNNTVFYYYETSDGVCLDGEYIGLPENFRNCTFEFELNKNGIAYMQYDDVIEEGTYKVYSDEIIFTDEDRYNLSYFTILNLYELEDEYGNLWIKAD